MKPNPVFVRLTANGTGKPVLLDPYVVKSVNPFHEFSIVSFGSADQTVTVRESSEEIETALHDAINLDNKLADQNPPEELVEECSTEPDEPAVEFLLVSGLTVLVHRRQVRFVTASEIDAEALSTVILQTGDAVTVCCNADESRRRLGMDEEPVKVRDSEEIPLSAGFSIDLPVDTVTEVRPEGSSRRCIVRLIGDTYLNVELSPDEMRRRIGPVS